MFYLTSSEAKLFQVLSLVDTLITSTVSAYQTAKSQAIEAWQVSKPYIILASKVAWVSFILVCGIVFYSGVLASKIYNWAKPRFLAWVDSIVQSGYPSESAVEAPETTVEASTPTATLEAPELAVEPLELPLINLQGVKLYKLHSHSVIQLESISIALPDSIHIYTLRGKPVIRLKDLENIARVTL